jgi:hypothetical protein
MSMQEATSDLGRKGAYRATWRKDNPRSLLQTIMRKNPKADEKKIHQIFWEEVEDDKLLLRACVEYWLDNNYRSLVQALEALPASPAELEKKKREREERIKSAAMKLSDRIEFEARRKLLEWIMPNDKKLGDCNRAECLRFGGWLDAVGMKVPPNSTVRQALSEDELQKIWKKRK